MDGRTIHANYPRTWLTRYYYSTSNPIITIPNFLNYLKYTGGYRTSVRIKVCCFSGTRYWEGYAIGNNSGVAIITGNSNLVTVSYSDETLSISINGTPYDVNVIIEQDYKSN